MFCETDLTTMTKEYAAYLDSPEWKIKRAQRLAIAKYRCAACNASEHVQVHHLTYARIFREEMADLLPLCKRHHEVAEKLVDAQMITRSDDVLFLATETVRLILCEENAIRGGRSSGVNAPKILPVERIKARNSTQATLLKFPDFVRFLSLDRKQFRKKIRRQFKRHPDKRLISANAGQLWRRARLAA